MNWLIIIAVLAFWLAAWAVNVWLARNHPNAGWARLTSPILFGVTLLVLWEGLVRGAGIPPVILPPPSMIWERIITSLDILFADFRQTFLVSSLRGYAIGCGAGFLTAVAIHRSDFWQRGVTPVGAFMAALPIIGTAPIMVQLYGFDWRSKAAVVVLMCFFPMLVNTAEGLKAADAMQRDLMRTYAASYRHRLLKLTLPAAAPFIFNGLKVCTTLALIGAIIAEFFGTPLGGMGFRITTEAGRFNFDMVWATIAVAALAGSVFYGAVSLIERAVTFWHPSMRR